MVMELDEEFFVSDDFLAPGSSVELHEFIEVFAREIEAGPVDVFVPRHPADGSLAAATVTLNALDDPAQYAHVFAEAGPEELAVLVFAKPVDLEDARSGVEAALHFDPMAEVVAHVVT